MTIYFNDESSITKISQLVNDSNYVTIKELNEKFADFSSFMMKIVDSLPTQGESTILYLVKEDTYLNAYVWSEDESKYYKICSDKNYDETLENIIQDLGALIDTKANQTKYKKIVISPTKWIEDTKTYNIEFNGVKEDSLVMLNVPYSEDETNEDLYIEHNIQAIKLEENKVILSCDSIPTQEITIILSLFDSQAI